MKKIYFDMLYVPYSYNLRIIIILGTLDLLFLRTVRQTNKAKQELPCSFVHFHFVQSTAFISTLLDIHESFVPARSQN